MRRLSLKYILILLIPLLLFASSPMSWMVCKMDMESCAHCCPHCDDEVNQANEPLTEITAQNLCCVLYESQGLTASNSLLTQRTEGFSKAQLDLLKIVFPHSFQPKIITYKSNLLIPYYYNPPNPPLFLSKQTFLI